MLVPLPVPAWSKSTLRYRTRPRPKRSFHTVLDAADLVHDGESTVVTLEDHGPAATLGVTVPLRVGRIEETVEHTVEGPARGLKVKRLDRRVLNREGSVSREEKIDFSSSTHALPSCTYVEVSMPFLLGAQPFDGKRRSIYAWICDRFVAKVYYESHGTETITVPHGKHKVREILLYPDLNDWVHLPGIITTLSKPFLPKYHMRYEVDPPHRLISFEGPYGPPGAPEIVLELESVS